MPEVFQNLNLKYYRAMEANYYGTKNRCTYLSKRIESPEINMLNWPSGFFTKVPETYIGKKIAS